MNTKFESLKASVQEIIDLILLRKTIEKQIINYWK